MTLKLILLVEQFFFFFLNIESNCSICYEEININRKHCRLVCGSIIYFSEFGYQSLIDII